MLPPCHDLIKEFSVLTEVPVSLDDVKDALLKRGVADEIYYFLEAALNPEILEGALVQWEYPNNGKMVRVAHIDCAKSLRPERKRLVVCKELLHLLDEPDMRVSTAEEFERLTSRLGLPPEDQDPVKDGDKTISDRVGIYKAIAVLFPWATREVFMKPFNEGKLSHEDIAKIVDIPARYAALVMTDVWEAVHNVLVQEFHEKDG